MSHPEAAAMHAPIDARELSKLRWRCRRGLLENDLLLERFFQHHEGRITGSQAAGLQALMELSDNDLLDLLLRRAEPSADLDGADVREVLQLLRRPRFDPIPATLTPKETA